MSPRRAERETNEVDPKIFSGNCINAVATFGNFIGNAKYLYEVSETVSYTYVFPAEETFLLSFAKHNFRTVNILRNRFTLCAILFPRLFERLLILVLVLSDYYLIISTRVFDSFFFFCSHKKRKGRKGYSKVFQTWRRVNLRGSEYLHSTSHPFCSRLSSPSRIVSRVGRHRLFLPSFEEAEYLHRLPCP